MWTPSCNWNFEISLHSLHPEFTISLTYVTVYNNAHPFFCLLLLTSFKGMRDDLTCILDEDLSSHCLCALHCEMQNTEQILKSVGLLAYEISSLPECNAELARYGLENFYGDRITVKVKSGQKTAVGRNNIKFASCSGQCSHQHFIVSFINHLPLNRLFIHVCRKIRS